METKICPKCKIEKTKNDFYTSKSSKDGLRWQCKECEKKINSSNEGKYSETRKKYRESEKYKQIKRNWL